MRALLPVALKRPVGLKRPAHSTIRNRERGIRPMQICSLLFRAPGTHRSPYLKRELNTELAPFPCRVM